VQYIYFPESTPDWHIFLINFLGLWIIPSFASTCGAGFGSALWQNAEWMAAYTNAGETTAGLIEYVLRPLGDVRFFFLFILAFSMMSNNVFNLYSVSISMQLFGKYPAMIPRFVYTFLITVIMVLVEPHQLLEKL
jgi:purine-cytosine permease-like protein